MSDHQDFGEILAHQIDRFYQALAPLDGGHPVTNCTVWRGSSPNDEYELVTLGNVLTYADTGLNNGQTYYYRIRATTILGTGIASNELNATPAAAPTVPSAPPDLQAGPESGQVVLTWSIPADNGGSDITSYKVFRGSTTANLVLIGTSMTKSVHRHRCRYWLKLCLWCGGKQRRR